MLFSILKKRTKTSEKKSYTSHLIKNPDLLAKKIGEESAELIIDFVKKNKDGAIKEVCHRLDLGLAAEIARQLKVTPKEAFAYRKMLSSEGNLYRASRTINRVHDK